ncbi:MAG: DEAD/DEAH box helicase [Planctomycetia bacterium]|nr:DEAD/DEAH box helicase [Planctomycetia bacterium]
MKTLEQRLFHLFPAADVARARTITPASVACPRVGQVRATVIGDDGDEHEVHLELSAHRRGGMTLETRCSTTAGRAGRPCAVLAAVLLEVDRRRLLSGIHDQTPVALSIVAEDGPADDAVEDDTLDDPADDTGAESAERGAGEPATASSWTPPPAARRGSQRLPPWAAELEDRRRLVEPAVRSHALVIPDQRRAGGALVFVLDLGASADARAAVLVPSRMQLDVAGNATGRPRPVVLGPGEVELDQLEPQERSIVEQLVGAAAAGEVTLPEPLERRMISRVVVSPKSAATHLAMLCEAGRLVVQPEPRRDPERVVPLTWDGGTPWEFAFVLEPEDEDVRPAKPRNQSAANDDDPLPRPAKATLRGMLVRGSQRKPLNEPKAVLRAGLVVFSDRIARLQSTADAATAAVSSGWMEQFERRGPIEVASSQVDGLIERLAMLADVPRLVLPAWTGWRIESGAPQPKLVLDDSPAVSLDEPAAPGGRRRQQTRVQLAGRVWFDYAGMMIAADDPAGGTADASRRIFVRRDRAAEREALALLPRHGATAPRGKALDDTAATHHVEIPRNRLDSSVSQLAASGWMVEVAGRRYRPAGSVAWNVTSGIDWFELSAAIDFGGVTAELPALLEAIARGSRAVELPDGSIGILPDTFAQEFEPMAALAQRHDGKLRFGRIQMALLDALLAGQPQSHVDEAFDRLREQLASGEQPEAEPEPPGFQGTLRHYQREGLGWLVFLEKLGLGGCLADDMGLGKTIQVLALLARRQADVRAAGLPHRPSLVIVPRSLVFNWIEEAKKFAPELKVVNHTGTTRADETGTLADWDIVITTYGTLRRDIITHRETEFDYVILDEAQSIKNAASQAAKACRLLRARHRLALTGTPVENHIGELWSIFEFLNPGQLGSASRLRKFLADGRGSTDIVARAVRPYLLRRTKSQVLSDLPEKTEQTLFVELGEAQRKAYDELREHFRAELAGRIGRMGIGRSRIAVLEALLRLRQTACHAGLVDHSRVDESCAKLDTLLEQLDEVLDEGHKVLVFSQFTSFLAILRRRLDEKKTVYEYLDGRTTDRQARVVRFQEDPDCRLFLVSLKAGGQGLNLTAADYIYILDPWWNPAVEAQAVDRAHRIGQTRRVFAYRLIARDTVEEKILALQDRKRELAESIVRADETMIASLTPEDVELLLS